MTEFGSLALEAREEKGWSLSDVIAAMKKTGGAEISRSQLCLIEQGSRIVTLTIAYDLCRALHLGIQDGISAAHRDRVTYALSRENNSLEQFAKEKRLGKKLDVTGIACQLQGRKSIA